MKLICHPLAMDDFKQIIEYCHLNFGIHTARKVRDKYRNDINLLKEEPNLGFEEYLLKNCGTLEYRSLVIKNTKVIYTIHPDYIFIHMLWNCRRQPESLQSEVSKRQY